VLVTHPYQGGQLTRHEHGAYWEDKNMGKRSATFQSQVALIEGDLLRHHFSSCASRNELRSAAFQSQVILIEGDLLQSSGGRVKRVLAIDSSDIIMPADRELIQFSP
jgi:hypothetical protein